MEVSRIFILLFWICLFLGNGSEADDTRGCSVHSYLSCHPRATCVDQIDGSFVCNCPSNAIGDGLKGENHTGCIFEGERVACLVNSTCHKTLGFCSNKSVCECLTGFDGDGVSNCKDINECSLTTNKCDQNARCVNTFGSYECVCKVGYKGDGSECNRTCIDDTNCEKNAVCNMKTQECECKKGYEGLPGNCTDINECQKKLCDKNAICKNLPGSFNCTCKPGLYGDGFSCSRTPLTCQSVLNMNPRATTGSYQIDPDGSGPLKPIKVYCIMRDDLGITVFQTDFHMWIRSGTYQVQYNAELSHIRKVIEASGFCYQDMSYRGKGSRLLDGGTYWTDGKGQKQYNWGGSNVTGKCLCGVIEFCKNPKEPCNNDETFTEKFDTGKIIDKSLLPIQSVTLNYKRRPALIRFKNVMCSSKPFDFPVDCHEAKLTYGIHQNESLFIDVDGPGGPRPPMPVYCQMKEEYHVGITIITHKVLLETNAKLGLTEIKYVNSMEDIKALIDHSKFCMQELKYECKNSGLMAGNSTAWIDRNGVAQDYWAGALGESGKCGCGILNTCDLPDVGCNCDIKDGKVREDFGFIIDKTKLPVTAIHFKDLPSGSWGKFTLGPLKCSQLQFGIKDSCQTYRLKGYKSSYTYLIDPDGFSGLPYFPVYCQMIQEPEYAITVVYHDHNNSVDATVKYIRATMKNVKSLIKFSTYCKQSFTYKCQHAPIHSGPNRDLPFYGPEGTSLASVHCDCENSKDCVKNVNCNCDANDDIQRIDTGTVTWKSFLPISKVAMHKYGAKSKADLVIGPLMCYDLKKNCDELVGKRRLYDQYPLTSGFYTIDPDGLNGVEPFKVECRWGVTYIETELNKKTENGSQCYDVSYDFKATPQQVTALVQNSGFCTQKLIYQCYQNPATDHLYFQTCDGVKQKGWAGSDGKDMCACGVTGTCEGKAGSKCNCDAEIDQWFRDDSYIQSKTRLPVCRVCAKVKDSIPGKTSPAIGVIVQGLYCSQKPIWRSDTCQDHRNNRVLQSGNYFLYSQSNRKQIPVYCQMIHTPPTGILVVFPKVSFYEVSVTGIDVSIEYYVLNMFYIKDLIATSIYCTQELTLSCQKGKLEINSKFGWFSRDGVLQTFWSGNEGGNGCQNGKCNCDGINDERKTDGGLLLNKEKLPVSRIKLGPSNGQRTLNIGPLKCYSVYRDCDEIREQRMWKNPLRNNIYSIDPDGAGGENLFAAKCDFVTDRGIGITEVEHSLYVPVSIGTSEAKLVNLTYSYATVEQVHALVQYDKYCHQDVSFTCVSTPLINNGNDMHGYLVSQNNKAMKNFGTGPWNGTVGCVCKVTNTCPANDSCHCDAKLPSEFNEIGVVTSKEQLPIRRASFKPSTQGGSAKFFIGPIRCAPRPIDLPSSCLEAQKRKMPPGETFIQPSKSVDPFFVYCDVKTFPGIVVTVIGNVQEKRTPFEKEIDITYHNVSYSQIEVLVEESFYCYQPVKLDCKKTMFVGVGGARWIGYNNHVNKYFGSSNNDEMKCTCGMEGLCGGKGGKEEMMKRACNCDNADNVWRRDAGILSEGDDLPIRSLKVPYVPNSKLALTVGKLYCANMPLDIDECALNFHDCHPNAKCVNTLEGFKCYCKKGFRGIGVPGSFANGRECPDDNECNMRMCPWSAICTNLPGSFKCTCRNGFKQTGNVTCEDIDECATGTHNCDRNANCINTQGSFFCRCKRNFRGNGTKGFCESIGICQCFGDPHCISFDSKWLHFQGKCKYVMATDRCTGNAVPTFEVQTLHWDEYGPNLGFSWVKEVTVIIGKVEIKLLQNKKLKVNGIYRNVPHAINDAIMIRPTPKFLELITNFGLKVSWDGVSLVEVKIPNSYKNKTCGLCGRFNNDPSDDWTVGEVCDNKGSLTNNTEVFGQSWLVTSYTDGVDVAKCKEGCKTEAKEKTCDPEKEDLAKYLCGKMENDFEACFAAMETEMREQYKFSCVYDLCHISANTTAGICQFASTILNECQVNMKLNTYSWRSYCPKECGRNQVYKLRRKVSDSRTCLTLNQKLTDAYVDDLDSHSEGCFCEDGYVMQDNECIKEQDCGCIYNGTYYAVGSMIVTDKCKEYAECAKGNRLTFKTLNCSPKADCGVRNGVYSCYCKDGFVGDGINCAVDYCSLPNMNCSSDAKCVSQDNGYICTCAEGYNTFCDHCEDIDECKTGTHKCDKVGDCINTIGSYKCSCPKGYYLDNRKCIDINECDMNKDNCPQNSRCFNKRGGFDCVCCSGYTKKNDKCVASGELKPREQTTCCACHGYLCGLKGMICGTDGITYSNMSEMIISACEKNTTIKLDYRHKCKKQCDQVKCPKYQICEVDQVTKRPTCKCEPCSDADNLKVPVCSQVNVIYDSMCEFKRFQCQFNIEQNILKPSECQLGVSSGAIGPWSKWSPCSKTCGKGKKTRSREALRTLDEFEKYSFPLKASADCYGKPCPQSPCANHKCSNDLQYCVVTNGRPSCECPTCIGEGKQPACARIYYGKYAYTEQTFKNPCEARRTACLKGQDLKLVDNVACGLLPVNCSYVANFVNVTDGVCANDGELNIGKCVGGCGMDTGNCCDVVAFEKVNVRLKCPNGSTRNKEVTKIKKCQCIEQKAITMAANST